MMKAAVRKEVLFLTLTSQIESKAFFINLSSL
jgi:hypothetical protein